VAETVENKQQRLDKLKARQQALLDQAKEVARRIARAESAEKAKRKKQDDRTKMLLGIAILGAAQKNPQVLAVLREAVNGLKPQDRDFLTRDSDLWLEVQRAKPTAQPAPVAGSNPQMEPPKSGQPQPANQPAAQPTPGHNPQQVNRPADAPKHGLIQR